MSAGGYEREGLEESRGRGRAYNRGPCRRKRKRANKEERTEEKFGGRRAGTVLWKTASRMKEARPLAH